MPELCIVVKDGSHYSPSHQESGYPLATVSNMKDNHIDIESCYRITQQDYELLVKNGCKVEIGDVLFSKDGTIGLCMVYSQKEPLVVLSSIAIIRPKYTMLSPHFLSYILQSHYIMNKIKGTKIGTALTRIIVRDIRRVKIPVPDLSEQQKIAFILSKVDELIQKTDRIIEQIQRLKKGLMQKLLTRGIGHTKFKKIRSFFGRYLDIPEEWNVVRLKDFAKVHYGLSQPPDEEKDGIPMIRATNIEKGIIDTTGILRIKADSIPKSKDVYLNTGDIIVVRSGAYTGDIGYVSKKFDGCVAGYDLIVSPIEGIDSIWLVNYLLSNTIQDYFAQLKSRVAQSHLNAEQLSNTEIYLPSISEQQKIANIISIVDNKIQLEIDQKLKQAALKRGLMQKLLTGKIRVKV